MSSIFPGIIHNYSITVQHRLPLLRNSLPPSMGLPPHHSRLVYFILALCFCFHGNFLVSCQNSTDLVKANATNILDNILKNANPRVRPNAGGPPVHVYCSFYITSFGSISDEKMEYTMDIHMRQRWRDTRLKFTEVDKPIVIPGKLIELVWIPDLYFPNEKKASFHTVPVPNRAMKVFPNGTVIYSVRITMTLACPMVLSHFPMDTQNCFFEIESYGHEEHDLVLAWSDDSELDDDLMLPQFDLIDSSRINCSRSYSTGNFPCLKIQFRLQRQFGFYMLQTYIPSILIVIISWVSFWINMDAVPARITLGVTTVLTMVTQLSGSRANLPKVSYPKAMDVWVAACMFFVFAALIEYAFVNVLGRRRTRQSVYGRPHDFADKDDDDEGNHMEDKSKLHTWKRYMQSRQAAVYLDKASRIIFPASFLTFNLFYWIIYMTPRWISYHEDQQ